MILCRRCGTPTWNKLYCGRTCANRTSAKTKLRPKCLVCTNRCNRTDAKTCSTKCRSKHLAIKYKGRTLNSGKTHFKKGRVPHNLKGEWITEKGYIVLYKPDHPSSNTKGYIREHRYVMEAHLGRPLTKDENIHHINGVKSDNRLENLELWSTSQPSGQRVSDKVEWAKQILEKYRV